MGDTISEYQKWKQQGDELRAKAKQAMEVRFRDLLAEAARIAEEYRLDFGSVLKPPSTVTVFRYKAHAKAKTKKAPKQQMPRTSENASSPSASGEKLNPKLAAIQKRLASAKHKLELARAAGKGTRPLEDRIYEIEDELRLANQPH